MNKKAFTLMEMLIVLTIITVLSAGVLALINPISIIQRGNDTVRRKELDDAKKMLEEYMTDTGCYPQPTQVCQEGTNTNGCHICTKGQVSPFSYFTKEICDPRHGSSKDFQYQIETRYVPKVGTVVASCPKWFRIFSVLDSPYNATDDIWGCKKGGCGATSNYGYDYLVTSPGAVTTGDYANINDWFCFFNDDCQNCYSFENCQLPSNDCYGKTLYPSRPNCCSVHNPKSSHCI